jgi:hypothetical protein
LDIIESSRASKSQPGRYYFKLARVWMEHLSGKGNPEIKPNDILRLAPENGFIQMPFASN